jgi:general stress protein 26
VSGISITESDRQRLHGATGLIASVDPDGYPHIVPVAVSVDGNVLMCNTGEQTRKVRNLQRDAKVGLCVHGDPKWSITLQGSAALQSVGEGRTIIRITPVRKIKFGYAD